MKFSYRSRLRLLTFVGYKKLPDWASWTSGLFLGISAGLLTVGFISTISGLVGLIDSASHTPKLLVSGTCLGIFGGYLFSIIRPPQKHRAADIFAGFFSFATSVGLSAATIFFVTGVTNQFDTAFYEATVAITTTALSTLDIAQLTPEIEFFRGFLQWVGGLTVLILGAAIIPVIGNRSDPSSQIERNDALSLGATRRTAIYNILSIYVPLSFSLWVAYSLTGIGIFDGLLLAISTVSTGGFVPQGSPLENAAVQWIAIVGMCMSGTSFVVLWRLATKKIGDLRNSLELRLYFSTLISLGLVLFIFSGESSFTNLRSSFVVVSSAVSTTGFPGMIQGEWLPAFTVLVLLVTAIGGMAGSASGGFNIRSLIILIRLSIRELVRQLHPRSIVHIQIDAKPLSESTVEHAVVLQFLFISVVTITSIASAIAGLDLFSAINASVHSAATAGPIRAINGDLVDPALWSRPIRMTLVPAMLLGWLTIFPVLIAAGEFVSLLKRKEKSIRRQILKIKASE